MTEWFFEFLWGISVYRVHGGMFVWIPMRYISLQSTWRNVCLNSYEVYHSTEYMTECLFGFLCCISVYRVHDRMFVWIPMKNISLQNTWRNVCLDSYVVYQSTEYMTECLFEFLRSISVYRVHDGMFVWIPMRYISLQSTWRNVCLNSYEVYQTTEYMTECLFGFLCCISVYRVHDRMFVWIPMGYISLQSTWRNVCLDSYGVHQSTGYMTECLFGFLWGTSVYRVQDGMFVRIPMLYISQQSTWQNVCLNSYVVYQSTEYMTECLFEFIWGIISIQGTWRNDFLNSYGVYQSTEYMAECLFEFLWGIAVYRVHDGMFVWIPMRYISLQSTWRNVCLDSYVVYQSTEYMTECLFEFLWRISVYRVHDGMFVWIPMLYISLQSTWQNVCLNSYGVYQSTEYMTECLFEFLWGISVYRVHDRMFVWIPMRYIRLQSTWRNVCLDSYVVYQSTEYMTECLFEFLWGISVYRLHDGCLFGFLCCISVYRVHDRMFVWVPMLYISLQGTWRNVCLKSYWVGPLYQSTEYMTECFFWFLWGISVYKVHDRMFVWIPMAYISLQSTWRNVCLNSYGVYQSTEYMTKCLFGFLWGISVYIVHDGMFVWIPMGYISLQSTWQNVCLDSYGVYLSTEYMTECLFGFLWGISVYRVHDRMFVWIPMGYISLQSTRRNVCLDSYGVYQSTEYMTECLFGFLWGISVYIVHDGMFVWIPMGYISLQSTWQNVCLDSYGVYLSTEYMTECLFGFLWGISVYRVHDRMFVWIPMGYISLQSTRRNVCLDSYGVYQSTEYMTECLFGFLWGISVYRVHDRMFVWIPMLYTSLQSTWQNVCLNSYVVYQSTGYMMECFFGLLWGISVYRVHDGMFVWIPMGYISLQSTWRNVCLNSYGVYQSTEYMT